MDVEEHNYRQIEMLNQRDQLRSLFVDALLTGLHPIGCRLRA